MAGTCRRTIKEDEDAVVLFCTDRHSNCVHAQRDGNTEKKKFTLANTSRAVTSGRLALSLRFHAITNRCGTQHRDGRI